MSQDITREEAAEVLDVELPMIDHWISVGYLASQEIEGEVMLDHDHVLGVKAQQEEACAALLEADRLVSSLEMLTPDEAAQMLDIDLVLLERRVRAGRLTPREIDGTVMFMRTEVVSLKEIEDKRKALMTEIYETLDDSGEENSKDH